LSDFYQVRSTAYTAAGAGINRVELGFSGFAELGQVSLENTAAANEQSVLFLQHTDAYSALHPRLYLEAGLTQAGQPLTHKPRNSNLLVGSWVLVGEVDQAGATTITLTAAIKMSRDPDPGPPGIPLHYSYSPYRQRHLHWPTGWIKKRLGF